MQFLRSMAMPTRKCIRQCTRSSLCWAAFQTHIDCDEQSVAHVVSLLCRVVVGVLGTNHVACAWIGQVTIFSAIVDLYLH
jgi:hypothetical protein